MLGISLSFIITIRKKITMTDRQNNNEQITTLLIDEGYLTNEQALHPFALTDLLIEFSGLTNQPILHFWQLEKAMILGMKDLRLPFLESGLSSLKESGYHYLVRNSGGLGVIADSGILNVSLILPNPPNKKLSIEEGYQKMWHWIKTTYPQKEIDAFEIGNSYCPGTFDLSIHQKKFAGISQRRIKNGLAIMVYLSVNGDQLARGKIVRQFYQASLKKQFGEKTTDYPAVDPMVMSTLEALIEKPLTIDEVKKNLIDKWNSSQTSKLKEQCADQLVTTAWFKDKWPTQLDKMHQRNKQLERSH